jgi:hypothetical protein
VWDAAERKHDGDDLTLREKTIKGHGKPWEASGSTSQSGRQVGLARNFWEDDGDDPEEAWRDIICLGIARLEDQWSPRIHLRPS